MAFKKFDQDKPKMHLLPAKALIGAADVMTYGAKKYADNNWRQATSWNRYYDAAMRHMVAWQQGEDVDESGFHPIDHAVCSLMMLSSLIKTGVGEDDRYRLATEEIGPGRNDNLPHVFSKESTVRTNKKG